ncbi:MAG: hypothetical protein AAF226_05500 [Verrucomicrobiota bacterium]
MKTLIILMLANQLQSLARMHRRGVWTDTPAEIDIKILHSSKVSSWQVEEAITEANLWGEPTDRLLEAINEFFGGSLDRGWIIRRAQQMSRDKTFNRLLNS